ncbi:MAG TPA: TolC family protein, partial [Vicinamibacterales bacterium]|nr:TolC family protein [Vicinamibacterales bacterium]
MNTAPTVVVHKIIPFQFVGSGDLGGTVRKNVLVPAVAALTAALAAAPVAAQSTQKSNEPDPAMVHALVQQALQQVQQVPQQPGQPSTPFVTPGPRVNISIEDAVARARDKNIDIAVAKITPRLTDFTIACLEANYRLNLTAATNSQRSSRFPTSTIQGISTITPTFSEGWSSGLAKNMWWGGGSWQLSFTNTRTNQQASNAIRNPTFQSGLSGTYVQPLLRGFKIDSTRAQLRTNRISQQNDEISLTATTFTTEANVRNAYWDLVYAIQAVEAAQGQLDLANRLVQDNQQRVEIGTLAPIDVVSAQSEAANRRQTLVQAEGTVRTSELALKRLIVSGTDDPLWTSSINPTDRPPSTNEAIDLEAAVARGLRDRTDLQQSMNNLKISDINLNAQVDLTRPQLNLTATYGLQGLGGPQIDRVNNITFPSGYFDALSTLGRFDAPQWNVALNFSYPLGTSAQESAVARSKLQLEQTQANLKSLQLQVATDVTNAALTVQSSLESVQASGAARELAKQKLDAAMSKAEVGMATNYEVVQAQRDFADAQNAELRAILNYRKALVNFEAAQTVGTRAVTGIANTGGGGGGTTGTATSGGTTG